MGRVARAPSHAATPNIRTVHPPRLPLPDHVHGLVSSDRSPRRGDEPEHDEMIEWKTACSPQARG